MRVAERARISQNVTPHVLRYYLPFLTMSGNGEPPRIWTGDFRDRVVQSPRTSPDIVLLPARDCSGMRGVGRWIESRIYPCSLSDLANGPICAAI